MQRKPHYLIQIGFVLLNAFAIVAIAKNKLLIVGTKKVTRIIRMEAAFINIRERKVDRERAPTARLYDVLRDSLMS